jgi:hypothetical protein
MHLYFCCYSSNWKWVGKVVGIKHTSTKYCLWVNNFNFLLCYFFLQILNRTNNIFELVTVEPVLTERPSDRKRDVVLLSDESDGLPDDKKLRLKGMKHKYEWCQMRFCWVFFWLEIYLHFAGPPLTYQISGYNLSSSLKGFYDHANVCTCVCMYSDVNVHVSM